LDGDARILASMLAVLEAGALVVEAIGMGGCT